MQSTDVHVRIAQQVQTPLKQYQRKKTMK